MSDASVIDALGGNRGIAAITGADPKTISGWRVRGIPSRYWLLVQRAAAEKEIDWQPPVPAAPAPAPEPAQ